MRENIEAAAAKARDWDVVEDVLKVSVAYGVPVASHDDDTAEKVARQAEMGVTISEFPVTRAAASAARDHGMKVIMGAPNAYRGVSTSSNLSAMDAIHAGLVDILATDYYPAAILHTVFKLAREGIMPLHESIRLGSTNAADVMGMGHLGRIDVGCSADLVLVHADDEYPRVRGTIRQGVPIYWDSHMTNLSVLTQLGAI
ncbi:MAG: amidohydrolase family protein [Chloroflexi bacterium]|nr:amidohydrolase family protein [Chloroflexota bacterium]